MSSCSSARKFWSTVTALTSSDGVGLLKFACLLAAGGISELASPCTRRAHMCENGGGRTLRMQMARPLTVQEA